MYKIAFAAAALAVAFAAPVSAATFTQYTSAAAFDAAVPGLPIETFASVVTDTTLAETPLTLGDMTVEATNPNGGGGFLIGTNKIDAPPTLGDLPTGSYVEMFVANPFGGGGRETQLEFTFAAPVRAFGFDYAALFSNPALRIAVDGENVSYGAMLSKGFWGFTSTTEFTKVVFSSGVVGKGVNGRLDNVRYGSLAAVPEPATWAMMIAGLCLVGGALRRRSHAVAAI